MLSIKVSLARQGAFLWKAVCTDPAGISALALLSISGREKADVKTRFEKTVKDVCVGLRLEEVAVVWSEEKKSPDPVTLGNAWLASRRAGEDHEQGAGDRREPGTQREP